MNAPRTPRPSPEVLAGIAGLAMILTGCLHPAASSGPTPQLRTHAGAETVRDEHSFARPDRVVTRHLALELALDFQRRILSGQALLELDWKTPAAGAVDLDLDSRDLTIRGAEASDNGRDWNAVPFDIGPVDPILGSHLTLHLDHPARRVRLTYQTAPGASGLQWLSPAMTLGGKTPFLFSQSQPIHARSWVPLQDTPSVRFTYEAHVTIPPEVLVLMSADNDPAAVRNGNYHFRMPQPIPSYLLAIAAGDLVFQPITPRTGIWAEPAMVAKAAAEFEDTGRMMDTAERLYGRYRWDRYDLLILPPSFPYGGMENPRLTFASPTVITGDRSLVSLVAHELAHSWSGNLVTFSSNRDMWLNEGFTTYVESRIIEALYGKERADMENLTARHELEVEFTESNRSLQPLVIPPGGLPDPEDHLTGTVYTKGAWFLQFLEQRFGRQVFDGFLRRYFDHFAFQSISSTQFIEYARQHLLDRHPGTVSREEFEAWLYQPGVPATAPRLTSPRLAAVDAARQHWLSQGALPEVGLTSGWGTQEWLHFLAGMPDRLDLAQVAALDTAYHFTGTPNAEIANVWYPLTVQSGATTARPAIAEYLTRVGRRRMVLPTWRALATTPEGRSFALQVLARARDGLHPMTLRAIESVLSTPGSSPP